MQAINHQLTHAKTQEILQDTSTVSSQPKQPVRRFQAGAVTATIWENTDTKDASKTYKTVSFDRAYKDKKGEWKNTNSLRVSDLPKAVIVLKKAYEFLVLRGFPDISSSR